MPATISLMGDRVTSDSEDHIAGQVIDPTVPVAEVGTGDTGESDDVLLSAS